MCVNTPFTSGVGELTIAVPRITGTAKPFTSKVLPAQARIVPKLLGLFPLLYIEGLSTRDFNWAMKGAFGEADLSKSSMSRANQVIHEEFGAWRTRSLADEDVVYLFIDSVYLQIRWHSTETEGVLVAHGIRAYGSRVLLGVALRSRESTAAWDIFCRILSAGGYGCPRW